MKKAEREVEEDSEGSSELRGGEGSWDNWVSSLRKCYFSEIMCRTPENREDRLFWTETVDTFWHKGYGEIFVVGRAEQL